jgi:predicted porin
MKFSRCAVAVATLTLAGLAQQAYAIQVIGDTLEVYGTLYPELNNTSYSASSATGTPMSSMTKGLVTPGTGTAAAGAISKDQTNWSQSYIGVKGSKSYGDVKIGYDFQGVIAPNKTLDSSIATGGQQSLFGDMRDAFVSIGHTSIGTFQFGQMDTIYKEYGDRVRMLDVSSSNFTSTSGVLSGVGWKGATGAGTTSFNTRIGSQIRWESPVYNNLNVGLSVRKDPNRTATQDTSLSAAALRWTKDEYYVSIQQETHNNYHSFSGTGLTALSATSIYNLATANSKDTGQRLSLGYTRGDWRLAADFATLKYTEEASSAGKFSSYKTNTYQFSADYAANAQWNLAANFASGAAGSCEVLGGTCSTVGQGGTLLSLGAKYNFDKNIGIFAMYGLNRSNGSATFASSAIGGNTTNVGLGLLLKF